MNITQIIVCFKMYFITVFSRRDLQQNQGLRSIGGRDAVPGEFPYVLKMDIKVERNPDWAAYYHLCTCSLLKPTWSLTSAHCIEQLDIVTTNPSVKGVIKYNISATLEGAYSYILSTFIHPGLYLSKYYTKNDVGLLLCEKITVSDFLHLSAVDYFSLYGSRVMAIYGLTLSSEGIYDDAHSLNKSLQVLDVIITKCSKRVYPAFCLVVICGKWSTLCPGDSGGPVLHLSGIVGINTAITIECNEKMSMKHNLRSSAGTITSISPYIEWISKIIR